MRRILPALFLICCLAPACPRPAQAAYMLGKELLQECMSDEPTDNYNCMGYITGVIDYHVLMQSLGTAPTLDFCLPDDVTVAQASIVVLDYLRTQPMNDEFIAAAVVPLALHAQYPCAPPSRGRKKRQ